jgi:predicted anti-sigma-YlaC factor YlaD
MPCPYTLEDLSAYIDGELDSATAVRVRDHLHVCPECEQQAGWLREVADMVRALPPAQPRQSTAWKVDQLAEGATRPVQCTTALAQASALIDGELPQDEAVLVQAHLYTCPNCYEAYRQLDRVAEIMHVGGPVQPPAGLEQRIWAAVEADERAVVRGWFRRAFDCAVPGFRCSLRLAAAAIFLLVVWSGVWHFMAPVVATKPAPMAARPVAAVEPHTARAAAPQPVPNDALRVNPLPGLSALAALPGWQPADVFGAVERATNALRVRERRGPPSAPPTSIPPRLPPPTVAVADAPTITAPPGPSSRPPVAPPPPPGAMASYAVMPPGAAAVDAPAPAPAVAASGGPKTTPPSGSAPVGPPSTRVADRGSDETLPGGPGLEVRVDRSPAGRRGSGTAGPDAARLEAEANRIGNQIDAAKRSQPARLKVPIR